MSDDRLQETCEYGRPCCESAWAIDAWCRVCLLAELARTQDALRVIAAAQSKTLGWIKAKGIVFDGPLGTDPKNWQHVAFSIYTDLCEVDMIARLTLDGEALAEGSVAREGER